MFVLESQRTATCIGNKTPAYCRHSVQFSTASLAFTRCIHSNVSECATITSFQTLTYSQFMTTFFYFIRHCSPFWEADSCSDFQETAHPLWNPKFYRSAYKTPSLDSESNQIYTLAPHFLTFTSTFSYHLTLVLPRAPFIFRFFY